MFVINNGPPLGIDPEASREGIAAHKQIIGRVKDGDVPARLNELRMGEKVDGEVRCRRQIGPDLDLSARIDLNAPGFVVDLKPGREIRGKHLLQVTISRVARGDPGVNGVVHLYQNGQTYVIEGSSPETDELVLEMARDARRILDIQEVFDKNGKRLQGCVRQRLGEEVVTRRQNLEKNKELVMADLNRRTRRI
jgi:hypothetical protein